MTTKRHPDPPKGLGNAGRALWRQIHRALVDGYEFDERELALLKQACRQQDDIAALEAARANASTTISGSKGQTIVNPLFAELRQSRAVLARLLGEIKLPDDDGKPQTAASRRAAKAANVRHGNFPTGARLDGRERSRGA